MTHKGLTSAGFARPYEWYVITHMNFGGKTFSRGCIAGPACVHRLNMKTTISMVLLLLKLKLVKLNTCTSQACKNFAGSAQGLQFLLLRISCDFLRKYFLRGI